MPRQSYRRDTCRLCGSPELKLVVPIQPSPVADAYRRPDAPGEPEPLFPLDLYLCGTCAHVQLCEVVNPLVLFPADYLYKTGGSKGLVEHFRRFAAHVAEKLSLIPGKRVVDVGSNDGTLLGFFKALGFEVLGIDAAEKIALEAAGAGIPTISGFFNKASAEDILREHGEAALVTANNVFAHSDELGEMAAGIALLLSIDGVFVFEVSYLVDIIDQMLFDTVYHEHLCYHSISPLRRFLSAHGLELFDVERIPTKGGSIRCFVQRVGGPRVIMPIVEELCLLEARRGLEREETFMQWSSRIASAKASLLTMLQDLRRSGKRVAGYGASATVTTLVQHFELAPFLDFLVDDNVTRHGMVSPRTRLEVKAPGALISEKVDVCVILAWQYQRPILEKNTLFVEGGGRFLLPLPEPDFA